MEIPCVYEGWDTRNAAEPRVAMHCYRASNRRTYAIVDLCFVPLLLGGGRVAAGGIERELGRPDPASLSALMGWRSAQQDE